MDIKTHNPAIRIHSVLKKGKHVFKTSPNIHTIHAWKAIFPLNDEFEFLTVYNEFTSLINDVKKYIESNYSEDTEKSIYLSYINPIISMSLPSSFSNPWSQTFSPINDHIINGIFMLSNIIKYTFSEQKISEEKLTEWKEVFNDLFNEIIKTENIDHNLKQILLKEMSFIIFTISQYEIYGSEGISLKIIESYARINFITKNNIEKNDIIERIKKAAYIVISSIAIASNLSQISGYDVKYLLEKPSEVEKIQLLDINDSIPPSKDHKSIT